MSNTDRIRAYYNLHRKCFSVQDYQSGLVIEHTDKLFVTNAMFVVRKSGNERVKQEGKKNVHAFVNGIRSKLKQGMMPEFASYKVRYDPYTMDYFHYERIVNGKPKWLPVSQHWVGNVWLYIVNGKPNIYADIDNISAVSDPSKLHKTSSVDQTFLRRKRKIIENKNKIIDKTIAI